MVIARTDLYIPEIGARSSRWRRTAVVHPHPATGVRRWGLVGRATAALAGVFSGWDQPDRAARRHHPVHRPDFVEGAAMSREMFRL